MSRELVPVDPIKAENPSDIDMVSNDLAQMAAQIGDGRLIKMEVDYSKQVDEALPKASAIARVCFYFYIHATIKPKRSKTS